MLKVCQFLSILSFHRNRYQCGTFLIFSHEDCTNGSGDGGCLSFRCPVVSMVVASSDATVSYVILSLAATSAASHCAEPWLDGPWGTWMELASDDSLF